jgi:hypothetical protein
VLRFDRPGSDEPQFLLTAGAKYDEDEPVPYPEAAIKISWKGFEEEFIADLNGELRLDPLFIKERWPKGAERVELNASFEEKSRKLNVTASELDYYLTNGAEILLKKGDSLAKEGDHKQASLVYWQSMNWSPSEAAAKGWATSLEKQGISGMALKAYQTSLASKVKDLGAREALKKRAIALGKSMKPAPVIPQAAREQQSGGAKAFKDKDPQKALLSYETASALAPWWADPYYSLAAVYEWMTFQHNMSYGPAAVANYELFLQAADSSDPRTAEARKGASELKSILKL